MAASFVRVKAENGSEVSVPEAIAEKHGLKVLDKPATDRRGAPLPEKHKTTVAKAAAGRSASADQTTPNPSGAGSNQED